MFFQNFLKGLKRQVIRATTSEQVVKGEITEIILHDQFLFVDFKGSFSIYAVVEKKH